MDDKTELRRKDFRTAILLIGLSLFFLSHTASLPFFKAGAAGVDSAQWYNSAALVPFIVFGLLLLCSVGLLIVAIRGGGTPAWLRRGAGAVTASVANPLRNDGTGRDGAIRIVAVSVIICAYIFALVPRVDFILCSALVLSALVIGFHQLRLRPAALATAAVLLPAAYALVMHFPRAQWQTAHDDDWLTLLAFIALVLAGWLEARAAAARVDRALRWMPVAALLIPAFLVCAMAFGFRQNVPNRGGLVFSQIEYHYYVNFKPLWADRQ